MHNLLTIDGGTTNTRISLFQYNKATDELKISVGARAALSDPTCLRHGVKQGISTLLERNGVNNSSIRAVIASGMLTSDSGLMPVPHIPAPAGVKELAGAMKPVVLEDIFSAPFYFVPGVRYNGEQPLATDVMRGEETECIGLMEQLQFDTGLLLLPGSHSKAICLQDGKIERFSTFLSGELLSAVRESTILKASVSFEGAVPIEEDLRMGYEYCEQEGVNKSLFKVRILANFLNASPNRVYSFYCGVLLHDEIRYLLQQPFEKVYIGGQTALKRMMKMLLNAYSDKQVIALEDDVCQRAAAIGAARLFCELEKKNV